jgi:hypothetical protein
MAPARIAAIAAARSTNSPSEAMPVGVDETKALSVRLRTVVARFGLPIPRAIVFRSPIASERKAISTSAMNPPGLTSLIAASTAAAPSRTISTAIANSSRRPAMGVAVRASNAPAAPPPRKARRATNGATSGAPATSAIPSPRKTRCRSASRRRHGRGRGS